MANQEPAMQSWRPILWTQYNETYLVTHIDYAPRMGAHTRAHIHTKSNHLLII